MTSADQADPDLLPQRPLSLGEKIERATGLFRATLGPAARVVLVVYAPLAVLSALSAEATADIDPFDPLGSLTAGDVALTGLATLVGFLVGPLVAAALTCLGVARARGEDPTWSDAYRMASGAFVPVILATLLLGLVALGVLVAVGAALAILGMASPGAALLFGLAVGLPALLVLVTLSYLLVPVILLDDTAPKEALSRAWALIRARLVPTLGTVVVAGLVAVIVGAAVGGLVAAVGTLAGPASFVFQAIGSALTSVVTVPFITYVALLIHADVTARLGVSQLPSAP